MIVPREFVYLGLLLLVQVGRQKCDFLVIRKDTGHLTLDRKYCPTC